MYGLSPSAVPATWIAPLVSGDCAAVLCRTVLPCKGCHFLSDHILSGLGKNLKALGYMGYRNKQMSGMRLCSCHSFKGGDKEKSERMKRERINLRGKKFII